MSGSACRTSHGFEIVRAKTFLNGLNHEDFEVEVFEDVIPMWNETRVHPEGYRLSPRREEGGDPRLLETIPAYDAGAGAERHRLSYLEVQLVDMFVWTTHIVLKEGSTDM